MCTIHSSSIVYRVIYTSNIHVFCKSCLKFTQESSSTKGALCQGWLKIGLVVLRNMKLLKTCGWMHRQWTIRKAYSAFSSGELKSKICPDLNLPFDD